MTEYTPTVEEVRRQWNNAVRSDLVPTRSAEFDRMIAAVERAAAVKALRDFALSGELNTHASIAADKRANRIESEEQA